MTVHGDQLTSLKDISIKTRVFLPSVTELGLEEMDMNRKRNDVVEGSPLPLFKYANMLGSAPDARPVALTGLNKRSFDPGLRSVPLSKFSTVFYAGQFGPPPCGGIAFYSCKGSCGIRPMIVMDPETELENLPDKFGAYILLNSKEGI